jgi:hypothetical protein
MKDKRVLDEASLLPPQIPALAMLLGGDFSDVFTAEDMAERAARLRGTLR